MPLMMRRLKISESINSFKVRKRRYANTLFPKWRLTAHGFLFLCPVDPAPIFSHSMYFDLPTAYCLLLTSYCICIIPLKARKARAMIPVIISVMAGPSRPLGSLALFCSFSLIAPTAIMATIHPMPLPAP